MAAENPLSRMRGKSNAARVRERNDLALERAMAEHMDAHPADDRGDDEHHQAWWDALGEDLEDHHQRMRRILETVRNVTVTHKVDGVEVPGRKRYEQVITRKSEAPIE
jgi:hypothetical protein